MEQLIRQADIGSILELGTNFGYSAILMARLLRMKNSLLVSKNSRLTFVMKAVLGLIITANAILAAYIVNFLVQHYSQFIEFLKRLFS